MPDSTEPRGRLTGRVALVTGGGSRRGPLQGTGEAMSILFAREGAKVCVVDLDEDRAATTKETIAAEGGEATAIVGDVSDEASCQRMLSEALEHYGRLDVLVNNAAIIGPFGSIAELSPGEWNKVLAVNLTGVMLMTRAALASLSDGGGAVVNIASTGALMSTGMTPAYGASKAALLRFTSDLAVAHGRDGIRVNAIAPGNIHTPMVADMVTPEIVEQLRRGNALALTGDAWDVAHAALFLVSDEARWITGICLPVDGGMSEINPTAIHKWIME